jgi:hydrogenase maturation protease
VASRLRDAGATVLDCADEPTRLLELWDGVGTLVVVDAVSAGAPVGTVVRADVGAGSLPPEIALASTHALGVGQALELGRALGRAPERVVLLGIEGTAYGMGDPMTPAVEAALDEVVTGALAELGIEEPCTSAR